MDVNGHEHDYSGSKATYYFKYVKPQYFSILW